MRQPCCPSAAVLAALLCGCGATGGDSISALASELSETEESDHFVFHHVPGAQVDGRRTEAFYGWISARLSITLKTKIDYFKFETVEQKTRLTGRAGNAFAIPWNDSVYTIWSWDDHEITHVLTYRLGYPTAFFNEGFAVANHADPLSDSYVHTWNGVPLHRCASDFLSEGAIPALSDILEDGTFRAADPDMTYPVAGSFVDYLTDQYGLQAVLQLFPDALWQDAKALTAARFQQAFGVTLETADRDWRAFLQQDPW